SPRQAVERHHYAPRRFASMICPNPPTAAPLHPALIHSLYRESATGGQEPIPPSPARRQIYVPEVTFLFPSDAGRSIDQGRIGDVTIELKAVSSAWHLMSYEAWGRRASSEKQERKSRLFQ